MAASESELAAKRERLGETIPPTTIAGTPDRIIEALAAYAAVGCQYVIYRTPDWFDPESLQLFSDAVIPALSKSA